MMEKADDKAGFDKERGMHRQPLSAGAQTKKNPFLEVKRDSSVFVIYRAVIIIPDAGVRFIALAH